ncbi:cation:proton antiporter [Mesorhizobium sp. CA16]|uniref:cation:proton antiporter domain-containing protein n=1 Tax=Mesorhizobium sp. CA16 TaxID=588496 RepID=UPI001CCE27F3|nr:cation:proton antiporter [Mesorhizobium sp. CA16]MBZ9915152.1 cation:proton antiporter [Mesorhizobium sp. CA16]
MHWLLGWSWAGASLFGVLIAATDPVSVLAAFKEMKVQPRLGLLVESESLLNDGAAAVGFAILVAVASGASATPVAIASSFVWIVAGGIAIGAAPAIAPTPAPLKTLPGNAYKFKEIVQEVQFALLAFGYYSGEIDGEMNPELRAGLSRMRADYSLKVTGTITPETLTALRIEAR